MKSIRTRMVLNFVIVIVFIVSVLGGLFIFTIREYYYASASQALSERADVSAEFYNKYMTDLSLWEKSRHIIDNIAPNSIAKIEILDLDGRLLLDSSYYPFLATIDTPDVKEAVKGKKGRWIGRNEETNERILAYSLPLQHHDQIGGVIRYSTSLELIDDVVRKITLIAVTIGVLVILVSWVISVLLSRRIIRPIIELTAIAEQMAGGEFRVQAVKRNEDEIGRLADTLNYMAEEITKNDQLKNEFIASVSHELRTPLTSIKGWSETLYLSYAADENNNADLCEGEHESEKEELRIGLTVITKESDRLVALVEDLLDFSKLQSGQMTVHLKPMQLNALIEEVSQQFRASCNRKGINFHVQADADPVWIAGDWNRLKQLLVNVMDNAIKFTGANGTIRLTVTAGPAIAIVQIADNGKGIAAEALPLIKGKFVKGKTTDAGSGLGLSIGEEIVHLHKGTMSINSELNKGTRVTIQLPTVE